MPGTTRASSKETSCLEFLKEGLVRGQSEEGEHAWLCGAAVQPGSFSWAQSLPSRLPLNYSPFQRGVSGRYIWSTAPNNPSLISSEDRGCSVPHEVSASLSRLNVRTGRTPKGREERHRPEVCGHVRLPAGLVCGVPAHNQSHSCPTRPHSSPHPTRSGSRVPPASPWSLLGLCPKLVWNLCWAPASQVPISGVCSVPVANLHPSGFKIAEA